MAGKNNFTPIPREDVYMPEIEGYDIERCQKTLGRIMKAINEVFEKNNIPYVAAFGTLLGAVRHNGFIPWDDDLDIFIYKSDYERALAALREGLPEDMIVQDGLVEPEYWTRWARVRDLNTVCESSLWPINNRLKYRGLACDLFYMEKMTVGDYYYRKSCCRLDSLIKGWKKPAEEKGIKGLAERIKKVMKLFYGGLVGICCGVQYLARPLRSREIIAGNLGASFSKMYEIADIGQPEKWPFEDTYVYIPENSDAVLKQLFGDYMTLPEPDKRKHHFKSVTFLKEKDD